MSDYDLQFQADLEKAQALSLESLALDQFRRQKQLSVDNGREAASSRRDSEPAPPALPPPPRKPPRPSLTSDTNRTPGSSPERSESSDLISFNSPTSKTPQDPHASLKEYINQLGQKTEELTLNNPEQAMNNQNYNARPGAPYYGVYNYNYQYVPAPYPAAPYGMPMPHPPSLPTNAPSLPTNSPSLPPTPGSYPPPYQAASPTYPPYAQTRLATPPVVPYVGYPPSVHSYTTTNMIARPTRPPSIYPSLNQMHNYPPATPPVNNINPPTVVKAEPSRDSVESNTSVLSEGSAVSGETNDTLGSLPASLNLIDFGSKHKSSGSVRVSVLEAFDPLLTEQSNTEYGVGSECSSSVYEEYDPLDFLYGETELREGPLYHALAKEAVPSPPPRNIPSVPAQPKRPTTNKLYDCIIKTRTRNYDTEQKAFLKMVLDVRKEFVYSDEKSNPGYVIAARSGGQYPPNTSVKVVVHHSHSDEPIMFTADVESTVEHIILTVVCSLGEDIGEDMSKYMLRVWGARQYLTVGSALSAYDYVRECVRLEQDVTLRLHSGPDASLARTHRDDVTHAHVTLDDLLPPHSASTLNFDNLSILFETLEGELSRAVGVVSAEGGCSASGVFQAVKAICACAANVETLHLTHALNAFAQACTAQGGEGGGVTPELGAEAGAYCCVSLRGATPRELAALHACRLRDAVRGLLALHARAALLDLALPDPDPDPDPDPRAKATPSSSVSENTLFCVEAVHCLPAAWAHEQYMFQAQLFHGTRALRTPHLTPASTLECGGFYPRIIFDTWLSLEDMPVKSLPREARLVLTLIGRSKRAAEGGEAAGAELYSQQELGWAALHMFHYDGTLAHGTYLLPLWAPSCDRRMPPAPHRHHAPAHTHAKVNIEIPLYAHNGVKYSCPEIPELSRDSLPKFESLDGHTRTQLLHLIEQGPYQRMPTECREIMWEKRQYLVEIPGALPLVVLAATNWCEDARAQLVGLIKCWEKPSPINALHLLLPCFPDYEVRKTATDLLQELSDDELLRILPQLVEALRYETYDVSPLAELLLRRALSVPAVAHKLFWLLVHSLPNLPQAPHQQFLGISLEEPVGADEEAGAGAGAGAGVGAGAGAGVGAGAGAGADWRYALMLRALLAVLGDNLTTCLLGQKLLVKTLSEVALSVKAAKEGARARALSAGGERLRAVLHRAPAALPLALHHAVTDIDLKSCTYFSSNTLPLKINFIGSDNVVIPAMFKVGDDLRQDALVLQVIRALDDLWLRAGLDLRIVSFAALPTSYKRGMIEIVSSAETLRAIQTEWGLTGSFKDKPIAEWLAKHNPSELEYQRARDNFTASCAGYSVATYLLGICDRHNDNIMLKTSGHLFHIDFGKFLGDAQMFGNFKRDRAPFVLTHDMAYVINGGERPTQRFQHFVELCCMAFNVLRSHQHHILDLFALMATSGVCGVTSAAVGYVRDALLPAASSAEAAAAFARLIHESLKSKFTPFNFFLHNLAQLRASGDTSSASSELLSFMPKTYTMSGEGRLVSVECLGYEKRYDPEKHYVYALRIRRQGQATPADLYRSYKHFTELHQKLCLHFPLAKVHSLPTGLHVGRSNTRIVAERRFADVQAFLTSLFALADEIAHSDLVYTFFHPLLRDQQDVQVQRLKHGAAEAAGAGALKLSVQFAGGALSVLVLHAQSLALTPQGLPPNPYVKVYLLPDPSKETKRKTRVLKRNSHPSFMEMLEYRLPLEVIRERTLQATVWHHDPLQENQFLGGVELRLHDLQLRQETLAWYPLHYIPR